MVDLIEWTKKQRQITKDHIQHEALLIKDKQYEL